MYGGKQWRYYVHYLGLNKSAKMWTFYMFYAHFSRDTQRGWTSAILIFNSDEMRFYAEKELFPWKKEPLRLNNIYELNRIVYIWNKTKPYLHNNVGGASLAKNQILYFYRYACREILFYRILLFQRPQIGISEWNGIAQYSIDPSTGAAKYFRKWHLIWWALSDI